MLYSLEGEGRVSVYPHPLTLLQHWLVASVQHFKSIPSLFIPHFQPELDIIFIQAVNEKEREISEVFMFV